MKKKNAFPGQGLARTFLRDQMKELKNSDTPWKKGKVFGFVYYPGDEQVSISEEFYRAWYYENTLNPSTFPSLKKFEKDIVRMAAGLMHGTQRVCGNVTTGGTESIFLAVKVARDLALESNPEKFRAGRQVPEIVIPQTIHPAFLKACHYLGLKPVRVPVDPGKKAGPAAMETAITGNTVLIACSAPCFPYGVVDPVEQIGKIARRKKLPFHVDACLGGFMLPFLEELGYPVPEFDFRVPGVSSISLDAHKYGYAPKGTSVILYRERRFRRKQFFIETEWPGGIFASTTFMGTKCGGPLAGTWAILNHLGREGYRRMASEVMASAVKIREGIGAIEGLNIIGRPEMTVFAFTSGNRDIYSIGDALERRGWHLDRLQFPEALHLTISKLNVGKEDEFLADLREIVGEQEQLRRSSRASRASVRLVGGLSGILPAGIFNGIARKAGKSMGSQGSRKTGEGGPLNAAEKPRDRKGPAGKGRGRSSAGSQAALYGISATFRNRKNVKKLVENLLDGMFS